MEVANVDGNLFGNVTGSPLDVEPPIAGFNANFMADAVVRMKEFPAEVIGTFALVFAGRGRSRSMCQIVSLAQHVKVEQEIIMRPINCKISCAVVACVMALAAGQALAAEKLGDILRESTWDRIIGTWVDAGTQGERFKTTYAWKYQDTVVEITTKEAKKETVSLMGVNAKNGDVFNLSADSEGGSSLGKWELEDGDAVLGLIFTGGDGQQGALSIRHHLEDDDTMIVTVELPHPIELKMIRAKPQE